MKFAGLCRCGLLSMLLAAVSAAYGEQEAEPRDPFWPVGYEKPKPPDPEEEIAKGVLAPRLEQKWPELPVQGTSRGAGGAYFAVIRGVGVVSAGEDVSLEKDGLWYHWRIEEIGSGGIRTLKLGVSKDRDTIPRPAAPTGAKQPVKE